MKKRKKGFTLMEMIAAIAIFAIISVGCISMISFCFKYNAINRQTYEADTNSKMFFECLNKKENRIQKPSATPAVPPAIIPSNGNYVFAFDDGSDAVAGIDSFIKNNILMNSMTSVGDPSADIGAVLSSVKAAFPNKKYAIVFSLEWNNSNEVYEFETWSWDLNKGEISVVKRKTFIGPKI